VKLDLMQRKSRSDVKTINLAFNKLTTSKEYHREQVELSRTTICNIFARITPRDLGQ
jgi:hypothetical protein